MFNKLIASLLMGFVFFSSYNKGDYLPSKNTITQTIVNALYKSNESDSFAGKFFDVCNFVVLPTLPKLACRVIVPVISNRIKEKAIITDINTIKITLNGEAITPILELATTQGDYYFSVNASYKRIFFGVESETTVNASFKAKVKCGFNLKNSFDVTVKHENKKIIIVFPRPTILSNEITMTNWTDKEGFLAPKAGGAIYNEINESAKAKAIEYANTDTFKEDAKKNISKVIYDSLPPLTSSQFGYNVVIVFQDENLKIKQENNDDNNL